LFWLRIILNLFNFKNDAYFLEQETFGSFTQVKTCNKFHLYIKIKEWTRPIRLESSMILCLFNDKYFNFSLIFFFVSLQDLYKDTIFRFFLRISIRFFRPYFQKDIIQNKIEIKRNNYFLSNFYLFFRIFHLNFLKNLLLLFYHSNIFDIDFCSF
jgi:hypothetical protein